MSLTQYSREGYDPEWLALEDAMGGRYRMDANIESKVPEFNQNFGALAKLWPEPPNPLEIHDEKVGDSQYEQTCRIYRPKSADQLPIMVLFHGGGFVAGNLDTDEPQCKYYAAGTPCVVVSIAYPLSPKYRYAQIQEACVEAVLWVRNNASRWNADPEKLLLCGGSAGSMLAQNVGYHFAYVKNDPELVYGCVLLYAALGNWNYDGEFLEQYRAWTEMAEADQPFLNRQLFQEVADKFWFVDWKSKEHFPLLEEDLSKYPSCYLVGASKDILKDDTKVFDLRLKKAGVKSMYKEYEGLPHWFHAFPQLKMAHVMIAETVEGIRWLLDGNEK